jgi:hypothetical protein
MGWRVSRLVAVFRCERMVVDDEDGPTVHDVVVCGYDSEDGFKAVMLFVDGELEKLDMEGFNTAFKPQEHEG